MEIAAFAGVRALLGWRSFWSSSSRPSMLRSSIISGQHRCSGICRARRAKSGCAQTRADRTQPRAHRDPDDSGPHADRDPLLLPGRVTIKAPAVIVLHGVHHLGIEEPRSVAFAKALSSHGFQAITPELNDLADYRVTPETHPNHRRVRAFCPAAFRASRRRSSA